VSLKSLIGGWFNDELADWKRMYKDLVKDYAAERVGRAKAEGEAAALRVDLDAAERYGKRMTEKVVALAGDKALQRDEINRLRAQVEGSEEAKG